MRLNQLHLLYLEASFRSETSVRVQKAGSVAPVAVGAGLQLELSWGRDPSGCCGVRDSLGVFRGAPGAGRGGQMLQENEELIYNPGRELVGHYSVTTRSLPIFPV